jgi:NADH pyrophosphatase NudC (nudix superfamily)
MRTDTRTCVFVFVCNMRCQAGGFARRCSASGRSVYPRIDPAIITLVTCGLDWCLLGRKADWPQGRCVGWW